MADRPERESAPGTPRWAKVVGVFVVMVLLATGLPLVGIPGPSDYIRLSSEGLSIRGHGRDFSDPNTSGNHGSGHQGATNTDAGDRRSGNHRTDQDRSRDHGSGGR